MQWLKVRPVIGEAVQRRRAIRYEMRVPVLFTWNDERGKKRQSAGFTRDICSRGLFVYCSECPPAGSVLNLSVVLPPFGESDSGVHLEAKGMVTRTERDRDRNGFAVASNFALPNTATGAIGK